MRHGHPATTGPQPGTLTLGAHTLRIRRNPGVGTPPVLWDLLDGRTVVTTFASHPSVSDCDSALARYREALPLGQRIDRAVATVMERSTSAARPNALIHKRRGRPRKRLTTEED